MFKFFDLHCDTPSKILDEGLKLKKNAAHVDLEQASRFSAGYAQVFALWGDGAAESATSRYPALLNSFLKEIEKNNDVISLCKSYSQMMEAIDEGKTAAFLMLEGAELIGCDPKRLREANDQGVIMTGITWNHDNELGFCAKSGSPEGLTQRGKEYVEEAARLQMLVDCSHLNEAGFWDSAELCGKRLLASHSNSRKVRDHFRNLSDEQFLWLCEHDCLVGLNLYSEFISEGSCTIDHLIDHIDHFMALGGEKTLCFGCDLDGCDSLPEGISRLSDIEKIYERLLQINYREDHLRDIFFNNAAEYFKALVG